MSTIYYVGDICRKGITMLPIEMAIHAYEWFEKNEESTEICVVGNDDRFAGLITKSELMHIFGGRYGYSLHQKKHVIDIIKRYPLIVEKDMPVENVARLAMERNSNELYEPIVVLDKEKYVGVVTIKDLLMTSFSIRVERANDSNPLTSLPGNRIIEQKIINLLEEKEFYAIIYLDLDNFKAYNDAYGFPNGDRMIKLLADVMHHVYDQRGFLGHIGGDDFVIITRENDIEQRLHKLIEEFKNSIHQLYHEHDWNRGYITAQSRKGTIEQFPIVSVSIAVITNQFHQYGGMMELTEQIVAAKKKAKQTEGNSIVVL